MNNLHPLWQKVWQIGRLARRAVVAYAISRALLCIFGITLLAVVVDYFLRLPTGIVRWGTTIAWLTAVVGTIVWSIRMLQQAKWGPLTIARRLETFFPQLAPQLTTAIDFLSPRSSQKQASGSAQLRELVVARAWSALQAQDAEQIIDRRPVRPLQWGVLIASALLVLGSAWQPQYTSVGMQRLLQPWHNGRWPQVHQLAFVGAPTVVTQGSNLQLIAVDQNGSPPEQVTLLLRWADEERTEQRSMSRRDDEWAAELTNITRPFSFRAIGGDDYSLPWQTVDVVDPLRLIPSELTATPPSYLHQPPYMVQSPVLLSAGSQLQWQGKLQTAARQVWVREVNTTNVVPGALASDGQSLQIPAAGHVWQPMQSGEWQLEVKDAAGRILQGPVVQVTSVPDEPPTIAWSDEQEIIAGPNSLIPLELSARDDHELSLLTIAVRHGDFQLQRQIVYEAARTNRRSTDSNAFDVVADSRTIGTQLDLRQFPTLHAGDELQLIATAQDFRPAGLPVLSPPRTLRIVTPEELQQRLLQTVTTLQQQLSLAVQTQTEAIAAADALAASSENDSQRAARKLDLITLQQQVAEILQAREQGLLANLRQWLQQWERHRLPLPAAAAAWEKIFAQAPLFESQQLQPLAELLAALQTTTAVHDDDAAQLQSLRTLQQTTLVQLQAWQREAAAGNDETRLFRELDQLRQDQAEVAQRTTQEQLHEFASLADNAPPPATDPAEAEPPFTILAQWELARRCDRWQAAFLASSLRDELKQAFVQAAIGTQMRGIARQLEQRKWTAASEGQKQVGRQLDDFLHRWQPEATLTTEDQQANLTAAEKQIDQWSKSLEQAIETWQKELIAAPSEQQRSAANRAFAQQLQDLAEEITAARELFTDASLLALQRELQRAAEVLRHAAQLADNDQPRPATAAANQAGQLFHSARDAIQSASAALAHNALREKLARLVRQLEEFIAQQEAILQRTAQCAAELDPLNPTLTRPQIAALQTLTDDQRRLSDNVITAADSVPVAVFQLQLQISAEQMQAATERLSEKQSDQTTLRHQEEALSQLKQIQAQIENVQQQAPTSPPGTTSPQQNDPAEQPPTKNPAELRLVAELQKQIVARQKSVDQLPENERAAAVAILHRQQQGLAELARHWTIDQHGAAALLPLPQPPATKSAADEMVADALTQGEDLGEQPPPFLVHLTHRLELAALLLNQSSTRSSALPLQSAIVQELEQLLAAQEQAQGTEQQTTNQPSGNGGNEQEPEGSATNSSPNEPTTVPHPIDQADLQKWKSSIWGLLPPQVQEQLQQSVETNFLPQYERKIREYYRRLAEEPAPVP